MVRILYLVKPDYFQQLQVQAVDDTIIQSPGLQDARQWWTITTDAFSLQFSALEDP